MTVFVKDFDSRLQDGVRVWFNQLEEGTAEVASVVALAGPPGSALLFRHLARPLAEAGVRLSAPELFHPAPAAGSVDALVERLVPLVPAGAVLMSHGSALPVAIELARRCAVRGLVILDGPLEGLDPVSTVFTALARTSSRGMARTVLDERVWSRLMASSLALRRLVVNPYVMDRDIVAMLGAPLTATLQHRQAVAQYLAELSALRPPWPDPGVPVLLVWGASNDIYPLPADPSASLSGAPIETASVAGGKHFHIEERPWACAEHVVRWLKETVAA